MREEVLSNVGTQDTDTRGYEVSDLEDIEFTWEDVVVDTDLIPIFATIFDGFQMGSTAANPTLVDDEEDREKSAPTITTPDSERPMNPQITEKSSIRDSTSKCA